MTEPFKIGVLSSRKEFSPTRENLPCGFLKRETKQNARVTSPVNVTIHLNVKNVYKAHTHTSALNDLKSPDSTGSGNCSHKQKTDQPAKLCRMI